MTNHNDSKQCPEYQDDQPSIFSWLDNNSERVWQEIHAYIDANPDFLNEKVSPEWMEVNFAHLLDDMHVFYTDEHLRTDRVREAKRRQQRHYRKTEHGRVALKVHGHNRRARIRNASGTHTASDIAAIRAAQTDRKGHLRCWWCSAVITDYHVDHKIPLSRGGSNSADNLCLACPTCNLRKNAQTPAEFAGRLI